MDRRGQPLFIIRPKLHVPWEINVASGDLMKIFFVDHDFDQLRWWGIFALASSATEPWRFKFIRKFGTDLRCTLVIHISISVRVFPFAEEPISDLSIVSVMRMACSGWSEPWLHKGLLEQNHEKGMRFLGCTPYVCVFELLSCKIVSKEYIKHGV